MTDRTYTRAEVEAIVKADREKGVRIVEKDYRDDSFDRGDAPAFVTVTVRTRIAEKLRARGPVEIPDAE